MQIFYTIFFLPSQKGKYLPDWFKMENRKNLSFPPIFTTFENQYFCAWLPGNEQAGILIRYDI